MLMHDIATPVADDLVRCPLLRPRTRLAMHIPSFSRLILGVALGAALLGGCGSTEDSSDPSTTTESFSGDTRLYRVSIDQRERDGECIRRSVLFTSYSRLYTEPHVDRVRAVDEHCDATDVSNFEQVEILRSPDQQIQYQNSFSFRNRINEDLSDAYETVLFEAEWKRRKAEQ